MDDEAVLSFIREQAVRATTRYASRGSTRTGEFRSPAGETACPTTVYNGSHLVARVD